MSQPNPDLSAVFSHEPPRTYGELRPWLQESYTELPKRLQRVAVFALDNPDVIALNTIAVISDQAEVNPSTMVRFAKSLGYQGFTDMQSVFQESMRHVPTPYSQRLDELSEGQAAEQSMLHRFSQAASASISQMEQQVDEAKILEAAQILSRAPSIYLAGLGRATPITTYLHYTFIKMGIQAVLIDGLASVMTDKARLIRKDEALIAVSFSPYTANTREIVDICLENNVRVVTLTDSLLSPIARPDSIHFEIPEEELGGIRGLSAVMCLALCLAVETGKLITKENKTRKE